MEEETTSTLSQSDTESDSKCLHGFEGCEKYVRRWKEVCFRDSSTVVTWEAGDPEDEIAKRIDGLEQQMKVLWRLRSVNKKKLGESSVWIELEADGDRALEELDAKLKARLAKSGEITFSRCKC